MKKYLYLLVALSLCTACREDVIDLYNAERPALNFAKGEFNPGTYPESYSFNAYFLGVGAGDYELQIPVRLQGTIDYDNDRHYHGAGQRREKPERRERRALLAQRGTDLP